MGDTAKVTSRRLATLRAGVRDLLGVNVTCTSSVSKIFVRDIKTNIMTRCRIAARIIHHVSDVNSELTEKHTVPVFARVSHNSISARRLSHKILSEVRLMDAVKNHSSKQDQPLSTSTRYSADSWRDLGMGRIQNMITATPTSPGATR
mmetsp:Transcript_36226/g.58155  ORF Transcript_36226/g.58155 Transcript_36226/m.58155 type:complete len:148 (-) Transcript_36226:1474-1917(-)